MESGSFSKYLLYALGEIALVVIGILIALQINNWHSNRKLIVKEKSYLENLKNELNQSLTRLDDSINFQELTMEHIDNILNHISNDLPYSPSLDSSFHIYQYSSIPQLSYTTYETIKTEGIDILNPDSLRSSLSKLYEEEYNFISSDLVNNERWFYQNHTLNFTVNNFIERSDLGISTPNDYNTLKVNEKFVNLLFKLKSIRTYSKFRLDISRTKTRETLELINQRISKI